MLFKTNPGLTVRLRKVATRDDAVLFMSMVHNLVTYNRDPKAPLFLPAFPEWVDHSKALPDKVVTSERASFHYLVSSTFG